MTKRVTGPEANYPGLEKSSGICIWPPSGWLAGIIKKPLTSVGDRLQRFAFDLLLPHT